MSIDAIPLQCSALAIFVIGYLILSQFLPRWAALLIALIKAAVPLVYFGFFFEDSGWTLHDDVQYYRVAASLLELGYRPADFLFDAEARDVLASAAQSQHTLYYLWNIIAQSVIGSYYYAAVVLNVLLTFLTGVMMVRILRLLNFSATFQRGALAFHMLHWDYLSWTSLINVKEAVVEALLIAAVYCMVRFICRGSWASLLGVAASFLVLFGIRLYAPFLILTAAGIWGLLAWPNPRKFLILPAVVVCLFLFYARIGDHDYELYPHLLFVGAVRFALTPQPWNITPAYSFLTIPMILQWIFVVPAAIGSVRLWQRNPTCRLPILVMLTFIAFYSIFPEYQGPRHRVQLVALMAFTQFHFVAGLLGINTDQLNAASSRTADDSE